MPVDYKLYPGNWFAIRAEILWRAGDQCECLGECGLHNGTDMFDGPAHRCIEKHLAKAIFARGKIILTVAHLNHKPMDVRRSNLKAMCQRCHLRYDRFLHAANAARTRAAKT
jgi:hypothetical protein